MAQQQVAWRAVIREDKRLRNMAESASAELAKYRYEHTIANGVGFKEYARQVGVDYNIISRYARAHELLLKRGDAASSPLDIETALMRASTSVDRGAVVEAIAQVRGIKPTTVMHDRHTKEVQRVQQFARERADRRGTSVAEEAVAAAEYTRKLDRANANSKATRQQHAMNRMFETDGALDDARKALQKALDASHGVNFTDDQRAMIVDALGKVKAVLRLLDLRFTNMAEVDWDGEMAKLAEGA